MNSVEEAVEAAAKGWHDRNEAEIQKKAYRALEDAERYQEGWDDPERYDEYYREVREVVELGPMPWEDCPEFGKEIARKKVRQTVLDALPAFLYALADETIVFADGAWTKPDEKIHLGWTAGYLKETAEEIKD